MKVTGNSKALGAALGRLRAKGAKIGFVPTLGSLHEGHLALVRRSRDENDVTVVSIFVNPLQFGPREDYKRYPRSLARDKRLLRRERADFLFTPSVKEIYPEDFETTVAVRRLERPLCGVTRPTHFAGVATVVLKLLHLVMPDVLYLGQKDYQQFRVVGQMVKDLGLAVRVRMAPVVREPDGLAMSSRNVFLSAAQRREARFLYRALRRGEAAVKSGARSAAAVKRAVQNTLRLARRGRVDYVEIVDAASLKRVVKLKKGGRILIALAVFFGKTRLIDNVLVRL